MVPKRGTKIPGFFFWGGGNLGKMSSSNKEFSFEKKQKKWGENTPDYYPFVFVVS